MSDERYHGADSFALLDFAQGASLVRDESAPMLYAVWLDDEIIGAGATSEQAIAEAREMLRRWKESGEEIF